MVRTKGEYSRSVTIRAKLNALDHERSDCTSFADQELEVLVAAGTYYVIVDGVWAQIVKTAPSPSRAI